MIATFKSSIFYSCSAKATKIRIGCWIEAAIEFCKIVVRALFLRAPVSFSETCASISMARSSNGRCGYEEKLTWCCNLAARVMRCQRRDRGFESPQHRHGIGRLEVRTLVCETKDAGANPVQSPNWV